MARAKTTISQSRPVTGGERYEKHPARIRGPERLPLRPVNPPVTRSRTRRREDPPEGGPVRIPRPERGPLSERQRRLRRRALPLAVLALIAFILGVISSAG